MSLQYSDSVLAELPWGRSTKAHSFSQKLERRTYQQVLCYLVEDTLLAVLLAVFVNTNLDMTTGFYTSSDGGCQVPYVVVLHMSEAAAPVL